MRQMLAAGAAVFALLGAVPSTSVQDEASEISAEDPGYSPQYSLLGCKWIVTQIRVSIPTPLTYYTTLKTGADRWTDANVKPNFLVNQSGTQNLSATTENRGNTVPWTGVARRPGTVSTFPGCTANGYWISGQMEVVLNSGLIGNYSSAQKNALAAHEFGHALGLGHNASRIDVLMYPNDGRTVGIPQADDRNGVNAMYP